MRAHTAAHNRVSSLSSLYMRTCRHSRLLLLQRQKKKRESSSFWSPKRPLCGSVCVVCVDDVENVWFIPIGFWMKRHGKCLYKSEKKRERERRQKSSHPFWGRTHKSSTGSPPQTFADRRPPPPPALVPLSLSLSISFISVLSCPFRAVKRRATLVEINLGQLGIFSHSTRQSPSPPPCTHTYRLWFYSPWHLGCLLAISRWERDFRKKGEERKGFME